MRMEMMFKPQEEDNSEITVKEALSYLQRGQVLLSLLAKKTYMFRYVKDKVEVTGEAEHFYLGIDDFAKLYKDAKFDVYEDDEETYDPKKDEEYYGWKEKTGIGL